MKKHMENIMKNTIKIIPMLLVTLSAAKIYPMDNKRPMGKDFEQQKQPKRMRAEETTPASSKMDQATLILEQLKNRNKKKTAIFLPMPITLKQPVIQPTVKNAPKTVPSVKDKVLISTTAQKSLAQNPSTTSSASSSSSLQQARIKIKHHTKLHKAAQKNDADTIRTLLKPVLSQQDLLKQTINALTSKGLTPLMFAAHFGSIDAFDALINNGADVTIKSLKNMTVFDFVVKRLNRLGQYNMQENRFITIKRDRYIRIYNTLLPYFADKITERQAQPKLLSYCSTQTVNRLYELTGWDERGAFQRAIMAKDIDEVERLLKEHPENINVPNKKGDTPLHVAARIGHVYLTKLLLNKSDPFKKNKDGKNVIDIVDELLATITESPAVETLEYNMMQINLQLEEARMIAQTSNQFRQASNAQSSSSVMPCQEMAPSAMSYQPQAAVSCSLRKDCHTCILPRNAQ
jgi:ankyrin repeat protein